MNINPSSSPLAFFAGEVKRLRGVADLTQEELAQAINYSPSTIAALETCRLLPSEELAEKVDKIFGTDGHLARLQELVEQTSVVPWFRELPKVERGASEIRMYEPYQVPALAPNLYVQTAKHHNPGNRQHPRRYMRVRQGL